jgi:hypothetical protein
MQNWSKSKQALIHVYQVFAPKNSGKMFLILESIQLIQLIQLMDQSINRIPELKFVW